MTRRLELEWKLHIISSVRCQQISASAILGTDRSFGLKLFFLLRLLISPHPASVNLKQIVSSHLHNGPYKSIGFSLPKGACFDWFAELADFVGRDNLVDLAMQSLSLAHIGKTQRDDTVLRMARICYGTILRYLQARVAKGYREFDFMRVNTLLMRYEVRYVLSTPILFVT